ncbi:unnamed protein product [Cyclocybe aegerita]|uniref:cAMP-independent regulatory protein pac2 n=1 Tax=Cyclocybe aegerita TaxID=1973307 RepID=A0A8S0W4A6_CYCAE|nr:unnamed protein product [Cyclocybe aegerita]
MQQPTCSNMRIRSTADAHKIFAAIQQNILSMVTRRLDADERLALRSGCIYAWEERGPHSEITGLGIERFTEGRRWSPSRVRDEFLFYYEKYSPPADANHLGTSAERQPPRDWDPLVKQTYSVWVDTEKGRRKWHLTAYFTQATIDQLGTVDDDMRLRNVIVADGMFKSTRVGKSRNRTEDHNRSDVARAASSVTRTYAPFPTPYQYQAHNGSPSMAPVLMHEPYQSTHAAERLQSPAYEHTPSPVSPQIQGQQYLPNQSNYPNSNPSPYIGSRYPTSPTNISQAMSSPAQSPQQYHLPSMHHHDHHGYYSPTPSSSSSWSNNQSQPYYSPSAHRPSASHFEAPQPSPYSPPSSYSNPPPPPSHHTGPVSPHPHPYSGPIPNNGSQLYSPSYSLGSALTPPPHPLPPPQTLAQPPPHAGHAHSPTDLEMRGPQLSPLQIPDRIYPSGSYTQPSPVSSAADGPLPPSIGGPGGPGSSGIENSDYALAPLNILKRPGRYRREPADEKTLRLLRAPQSSP